MEGALAPTELYRLKGPGVQITCRPWKRALTYEIAELGPDGSSLSGSSDTTSVSEPGIGIRVDAELCSSINGTIMLTLLLSEMRWGGVEETSCNGAAIITHGVRILEADSYPLQRYDVTALKGTASWEGV